MNIMPWFWWHCYYKTILAHPEIILSNQTPIPTVTYANDTQ